MSILDNPLVVTIDWGEGYTSPPIGPFETRGQANRAMTAIRKRLRRQGRRWQGTVKAHYIASLETALSWGP